MRAPLEAALEAVALRLAEHRVPFLLGGSALLDALGLDVEVRDVDLMLRPEDRAAFEAACGGVAASPSRPSRARCSPATGRPRSTSAGSRSRASAASAFAGGAAGAVPGRRARAATAPREVPLCDPAVWLELYRAYKPEKAALLERRLRLGREVREPPARRSSARGRLIGLSPSNPPLDARGLETLPLRPAVGPAGATPTRSPSGAGQVRGVVERPQQPVADAELHDPRDRAVVGVDEGERARAA